MLNAFYNCPRCAAPHSPTVGRCPCGYCFDRESPKDEKLALRFAVEEEKQYEQYLAARLTQAAEAARVATKIASMDANNKTKIIEASRAKQEFNAVKHELTAQRVRVVQAVKVAKLRRAAGNTKSAHSAKANGTFARSAGGGRVQSSTQSRPITQMTARIPNLIESKAARPIPRTRIGHGTLRQSPSAVLRTSQAAVATDAMRSAVAPELKECLWCTATYPLSVARCQCGYKFPPPQGDIPSL